MDNDSLVRGLALGEIEAPLSVREQLMSTFWQGEQAAGLISFREWVAGAEELFLSARALIAAEA